MKTAFTAIHPHRRSPGAAQLRRALGSLAVGLSMSSTLLVAVAAVALTLPSTSQAQAQPRIRHMGLPAMLPPLVEVQPGLQVVQDFPEEIFFDGASYWTARHGHWYRTWDHRSTWYLAKPRDVPAFLVHHRPGQYRNWQHDERLVWPAAVTRDDSRHWAPADRQGPGLPQRADAR